MLHCFSVCVLRLRGLVYSTCEKRFWAYQSSQNISICLSHISTNAGRQTDSKSTSMTDVTLLWLFGDSGHISQTRPLLTTFSRSRGCGGRGQPISWPQSQLTFSPWSPWHQHPPQHLWATHILLQLKRRLSFSRLHLAVSLRIIVTHSPESNPITADGREYTSAHALCPL